LKSTYIGTQVLGDETAADHKGIKPKFFYLSQHYRMGGKDRS